MFTHIVHAQFADKRINRPSLSYSVCVSCMCSKLLVVNCYANYKYIQFVDYTLVKRVDVVSCIAFLHSKQV